MSLKVEITITHDLHEDAPPDFAWAYEQTVLGYAQEFQHQLDADSHTITLIATGPAARDYLRKLQRE